MLSDHLLNLSGLAPSPEERAAMAEAFPLTRAAVRALYAVAEARYEAPAVGWSAIP
jgi:hypothetical protein